MRALRGLAYLEGDGVARAVLVPGAWCVVPALPALLTDTVSRRRDAG